MLRMMIYLGFHGKRHKIAAALIFEYMHNNGLGV